MNIFKIEERKYLRQWVEYADATNEWIGIIRPALPEGRHAISLIVVGFGGSVSTPKSLFINDGEEMIFKTLVSSNNNPVVIPFPVPLLGSVGKSIGIGVEPSGDSSILITCSIVGFDLY